MEDQKSKPGKNQLDIELNDDVAQGTYSNLAVITHSSAEFVLDFVRIMPGVPKAHVKSRVILTPEHAKRLLRALDDNIKKVVFDLENIKRMNSTGLGILMRSYTTLKNNEADLKLVCLNESVQGVMVLTKMNTVFEIYRTIGVAVRNF